MPKLAISIVLYAPDRPLPKEGVDALLQACQVINSFLNTALKVKLPSIRLEWYLDNKTWCGHVQDGSYQGERLGLVGK
jgi:hypothetical protein